MCTPLVSCFPRNDIIDLATTLLSMLVQVYYDSAGGLNTYICIASTALPATSQGCTWMYTAYSSSRALALLWDRGHWCNPISQFALESGLLSWTCKSSKRYQPAQTQSVSSLVVVESWLSTLTRVWYDNNKTEDNKHLSGLNKTHKHMHNSTKHANAFRGGKCNKCAMLYVYLVLHPTRRQHLQ